MDANGTVTDRYEYDAWGNLIASTGNTPNSRAYAGEEFDADLGLLNLRARYYQPGRGRFGTLDSSDGVVGVPVTSHQYLYANGDPANLADPTGHFAGVEEGLLIQVPARIITVAPYGGAAAAAAGATAASAGLALGVVGIVGYKTACNFWKGWSAFELLDSAAEDRDPESPPAPFEDCKVCPPCKGPLPPPRFHKVPPSKKHYPCPGDHIHTFIWRQNPKTCDCYINKQVICL
jgi:RHS repeat-associated protein